MLSENFFVHGSDAPSPEPLPFRAGPLEMFFEPETVFLRRISLGGVEIIRGIYAAVRDRNWGTVAPRLENLRVETTADGGRIGFDVDCRQPGINFRWHGEITGAADGTVQFTFDGEAKTTFLRNRIGFCVLHPIRECAGARARYERVDGQVVDLRFPTLIEPQIFGQASFRDLRSMAHEVKPGLWARLEFEGEIFETEDQRNWTDASFKTYCTPLALPFPVEVRAVTRIRQMVTLRLVPETFSGDSAVGNGRQKVFESGTPKPDTVQLAVPKEPIAALPQIGVGLASHGHPLTAAEATHLRDLKLSHLRVDLRSRRPEEADSWPQTLSRAVTEAAQLETALEIALHLPRENAGRALRDLTATLDHSQVRIVRLLVLRDGEAATSPATLQFAREHLGPLGIPIGAGTDAHFCELNRERALGRLALENADFVSWPITPQVHAFDNLSLIETLEAQPETIASARAFSGTKPLVISPVTLKPRFNSVATSADDQPRQDQLPPQVDPRQMTLFNAAWTLGSITALSLAGAASITYFETTGWRGLMETAQGSPLHSLFPSTPGMIFPAFHVFAALSGFNRLAPLEQTNDDTQPCWTGFCLFDDAGRRRVMLADLGGRGLRLSVDPGKCSGRSSDVRVSAAELEGMPKALSPGLTGAAPGPLRLALPAHGLAFIDLSGPG